MNENKEQKQKKKLPIGILLILILFILGLLALTSGCESHKSSQPDRLPTNAINVTDKGNGWTTFDLDGNRFLYHRSHWGSNGWEAITLIPQEE